MISNQTKEPTLSESIDELREALKDVLFSFCSVTGIVWIVNKSKYLKLKPWAKDRFNKK